MNIVWLTPDLQFGKKCWNFNNAFSVLKQKRRRIKKLIKSNKIVLWRKSNIKISLFELAFVSLVLCIEKSHAKNWKDYFEFEDLWKNVWLFLAYSSWHKLIDITDASFVSEMLTFRTLNNLISQINNLIYLVPLRLYVSG